MTKRLLAITLILLVTPWTRCFAASAPSEIKEGGFGGDAVSSGPYATVAGI